MKSSASEPGLIVLLEIPSANLRRRKIKRKCNDTISSPEKQLLPLSKKNQSYCEEFGHHPYWTLKKNKNEDNLMSY